MIFGLRTGRLFKALQKSAAARTHAQFTFTAARNPAEAPDPVSGSAPDGYHRIASGDGTEGPVLVRFLPYARGPAGSHFSVRLFGVYQSDGDEREAVWVYALLGNFACVVGDIPGPAESQSAEPRRRVAAGERFCDFVTAPAGGPGSGVVWAPGSGYAAVVEVPTFGAQTIFWDFATDGRCAANALWQRG